jgi:nitrous oxidase accessory protein NosD
MPITAVPLSARTIRRVIALALTTLLASMALAAGGARAATAATLFVSSAGNDSGNCQAPGHPCASIGYALSQASAHALVLVGPGTYPESASPGATNRIGARLHGVTLASNPSMGASAANTIIDATGAPNGVLVRANGATVRGFTIKNADLEGILVEPPPGTWPDSPSAPAAGLSNVTIRDNVVVHNDRSYDTSADPSNACPTSPTDTDDCGEGIHLMGTSHSRVIGNRVAHNVGGILLSDGGLPTGPGGPTSVGPAADNLIAFNVSVDNAFDCGITLPSHDPRAVATSGPNAGQPQPKLAGVYGNVVVNNVSSRNGGAGLLDATPYPGTGAYDNVFASNKVKGNGEGGFQLHSHAPFQDVDGLRIVDNHFGRNNVAGDPDSGDMATTAIILFSAVVPVNDTVVAGNSIAHNAIGVWKTGNVQTSGLASNHFLDVVTKVFTM